MIGRILRLALAGAALLASEASAFETAALADGCLSAAQTRAAVQNGQVAPLGQILAGVRAAAPGKIVSTPQLCQFGGQYVYQVTVLKGNGQVTRLTVDAASGSILGQ
jgi:uncharacterized membrane protein YkoI